MRGRKRGWKRGRKRGGWRLTAPLRRAHPSVALRVWGSRSLRRDARGRRRRALRRRRLRPAGLLVRAPARRASKAGVLEQHKQDGSLAVVHALAGFHLVGVPVTGAHPAPLDLGTEEGASEHTPTPSGSYGSGVASKLTLRCPQAGAGVRALVPAAWVLIGARAEQNSRGIARVATLTAFASFR
jgi:hypothetical protein